MSDTYYSNCLLEYIKAKIRYRKEIKIIHVISKDGLHHIMWHDFKDNNVYDFQQVETVKHWFNLLWYKGKIRITPYRVYESWVNKEG